MFSTFLLKFVVFPFQDYNDIIDLMQQRQLIGVEGVETPANCLPTEFSKSNVSPE